MFTIKHVAEMVGISEATVRAWERRYGVEPTSRTESGYRLYDDEAIAALRSIKDLVDAGWSTKEAAREICGPRLALVPFTLDEDALLSPAQSFSADELSAVLDAASSGGGVAERADTWLLPALKRLGEAWAAGDVTVAGEHFVSHAVMRRLSTEYDEAAALATGPAVVIGLAPESHHDLGLLCYATVARRAGTATRYLGADVPVNSWIESVRDADVAGAVLAVPREKDARSVTLVARALRMARPDLPIAVGGAFQDQAPDFCQRLGHEITEAARLTNRMVEQPQA